MLERFVHTNCDLQHSGQLQARQYFHAVHFNGILKKVLVLTQCGATSSFDPILSLQGQQSPSSTSRWVACDSRSSSTSFSSVGETAWLHAVVYFIPAQDCVIPYAHMITKGT